MPKHKNYGKATVIILKEMFKRVGARFTYKALEDENWFQQHSWTKVGEKDFGKWLRDWLDANCSKYTDELKWRKSMSAQTKSKIISYFLFDYGWRLEEKDE